MRKEVKQLAVRGVRNWWRGGTAKYLSCWCKSLVCRDLGGSVATWRWFAFDVVRMYACAPKRLPNPTNPHFPPIPYTPNHVQPTDDSWKRCKLPKRTPRPVVIPSAYASRDRLLTRPCRACEIKWPGWTRRWVPRAAPPWSSPTKWDRRSV